MPLTLRIDVPICQQHLSPCELLTCNILFAKALCPNTKLTHVHALESARAERFRKPTTVWWKSNSPFLEA